MAVKPFGIPSAPNVPIDASGKIVINPIWYRFFNDLFFIVGSGQSTVTLTQVVAGTTNIALTVPAFLQVSGSPILGGVGTFAISSATVTKNEVLASPDGSNGALSPRVLVAADLPFHLLTGNAIAGVITNASASAGYPGEYISSSIAAGAAVSLTTATSLDVTTISLTHGDWDVFGSIYFVPAGGAVITAESGGISTTANTLPTAPAGGFASVAGLTQAAGTAISLILGMTRISINSTTTVRLVAQASFSSTCGVYGIIQARRSSNVF